MMQRGLIQKIIKATNMENCNKNWMTVVAVALGSDPEGAPMTKNWSYPSIVRMMLYLSTNMCPDITFAVSQVARFNHAPKQSHATAVNTIVRYLAGTADKGMIVKSTKTSDINAYVDADFAGLHGSKEPQNPASAKSRTGWITFLSDCPLIWRSQLFRNIH